jgi:hypothetical protein
MGLYIRLTICVTCHNSLCHRGVLTFSLLLLQLWYILIMSSKGGRPQDVIWEHFLKVKKGDKLLAKCVQCDLEQQPKVLRMKAHWSIC